MADALYDHIYLGLQTVWEEKHTLNTSTLGAADNGKNQKGYKGSVRILRCRNRGICDCCAILDESKLRSLATTTNHEESSVTLSSAPRTDHKNGGFTTVSKTFFFNARLHVLSNSVGYKMFTWERVTPDGTRNGQKGTGNK